jgi:hypothetical protein
MKTGDLIYHVDDRSDNKQVVGIILGVATINDDPGFHVLFTDRATIETWPSEELKHVERNENW